MFSTFLLAPSDFQTFLCHIQQHQHQLQLARPALFIFSFRPKNLAEVIVRHCQSTVSVTSKARDLGIEQRHKFYQLMSTPRDSLPHGMCYSLLGNGVCNGAISITQWGFISDYCKVKPIGQWGKILVMAMGIVDHLGASQYYEIHLQGYVLPKVRLIALLLNHFEI